MYILVSKVFYTNLRADPPCLTKPVFFQSNIPGEFQITLISVSTEKINQSPLFSRKRGEKVWKNKFWVGKKVFSENTPRREKNKNFTLHFSISLTDRQPRASRNRSHVFSHYVGGYLLFSPKRRNCFVYSRRI